MKMPTTLCLLAALCFCVPTVVQAQDGESRPKRSSLPRMFRDLDLSEDQQASLEKAIAEYREAFKKARSDSDRGAMREAREAFSKSLEKILDKKQMDKLQRRQRRPRGGRSSGPSVGTVAPNFTAKVLGEEKQIELQSLVAKTKKPVVLIFGSIT